jgi:hypothetical protein
MAKSNPGEQETGEQYRLPGCNCYQPCELSDAWRCARDKALQGRIGCDCESHRYIQRQAAALGETE